MAAVAVAAGVGALVPVRPEIAFVLVGGLGAAVLVSRLGAVSALLHLLVISVFIESIGVGPARVGRLLAVVVLLVIFLRIVLTRWSPPRVPALIWLPAFAFLTWAWASGLWSDSVSSWLEAMGSLALAASYFLGFALLSSSEGQVRQLLRAYAIGSICVAFYALYQASFGERAAGLQGDPNIYAVYQVAAIPVVGMLSRTAADPRIKGAWLVAVVPLIASVFAAQSRGGLLAAAVIVVFIAARGDLVPATRHHPLLAGTIALALVAGLGSIGTRVDERLSAEAVTESRGTGRIDIWQVAWEAYKDQPVLGLGAGNFESTSVRLLQTTPGVELNPNSILLKGGIRVHNVYLETLTEFGPLGLVLWLTILTATGAGLIRMAGLGASARPSSALLPMLIAIAVATVFLSVTNNKLLWMLVGLTAAGLRRHDQIGGAMGRATS